MKKSGFWSSDWFFGLVIVLVVFGFAKTGNFFDSLETKAYDWGVQATSKPASDKVAVIAIDDQSIANIGRWPWSRETHANMIDKLAGAKARVIGHTVFFFEPQIDPGLTYINKLVAVANKAKASEASTVGGAPEAVAPSEFDAILAEAEQALNTDRRLAESIKKAGNVVLPSLFELSAEPPAGRPDKELPEFAKRNAVAEATNADGEFVYGTPNANMPIEALGSVALGIGHLTPNPDTDGGVRQDVTVIDYFGKQYPSLAMLVAAKSLNLSSKDVRVNLGESVSLGNLRILTDRRALMRPYYYKSIGDKPAIPVDSFFDVLTGKIPASKYQDKIVLIGPTAAGVGAAQLTPIGQMTPVESLAHSVSSILKEHFFRTPLWTAWVALLAFVLVALYLIVLLPRLRAGPAALFTLALLLVLAASHFGLMMGPGIWVQLALPASLLVIGHLLLTTKRFLMTERGKEQSEAAGAESNRMLGLAFQQQGQLDMAFDKFRKCPVDEQLLENVYSLALDFERRRQFNKAESAFQFIHANEPGFKDVADRMNRAKAMSETIILGGSAGARSNAATMVLSSAGEKPKLGRYSVEKELGKGAMGVVYLGKDPKIGREVAIKTMALSAEFEGDELQEAKDRFFREAESAGKLDHPNIVRIFDAGEEHDLAYIAMEFLKGKDLVPHTKMPNLLPLDQLLSIIERTAEGLHHAHSMNIVHRDIKPANIMYDPDTDTPKITDFGIARVTDSSKTKTGMVLGTPSYMSPEQLAGKKIDGRSDLFSLAVTLYQMACGRLPFEGESMTQLMYAIANQDHPNILEYNSALPPWMKSLLDKALEKDAGARFQTGADFAAAIRKFRKLG